MTPDLPQAECQVLGLCVLLQLCSSGLTMAVKPRSGKTGQELSIQHPDPATHDPLQSPQLLVAQGPEHLQPPRSLAPLEFLEVFPAWYPQLSIHTPVSVAMAEITTACMQNLTRFKRSLVSDTAAVFHTALSVTI